MRNPLEDSTGFWAQPLNFNNNKKKQPLRWSLFPRCPHCAKPASSQKRRNDNTAHETQISPCTIHNKTNG